MATVTRAIIRQLQEEKMDQAVFTVLESILWLIQREFPTHRLQIRKAMRGYAELVEQAAWEVSYPTRPWWKQILCFGQQRYRAIVVIRMDFGLRLTVGTGLPVNLDEILLQRLTEALPETDFQLIRWS